MKRLFIRVSVSILGTGVRWGDERAPPGSVCDPLRVSMENDSGEVEARVNRCRDEAWMNSARGAETGQVTSEA